MILKAQGQLRTSEPSSKTSKLLVGQILDLSDGVVGWDDLGGRDQGQDCLLALVCSSQWRDPSHLRWVHLTLSRGSVKDFGLLLGNQSNQKTPLPLVKGPTHNFRID